MSDNILTLKFPHRSFWPPPKKASLVAPRSTPCTIRYLIQRMVTVVYILSIVVFSSDSGLICVRVIFFTQHFSCSMNHVMWTGAILFSCPCMTINTTASWRGSVGTGTECQRTTSYPRTNTTRARASNSAIVG